MNEALVEMLEYNRWANHELFEALRPLEHATLSARPAGISGTIGELLTHIVGGEQTFLLRTRGRQHEGELNRRSPFPGIDELLRLGDESSAGLVEVARSLAPGAEVDLPWMGKTFRFPVRFFLVHAIEHAMEHRTEVKVGLSQLGIETPDLDGWNYAAAKGYGTEV